MIRIGITNSPWRPPNSEMPRVGCTAAANLRGGAWNNNAQNLRAANRNHNAPDNRNNNIGFRLARTPKWSARLVECSVRGHVPLRRRGVYMGGPGVGWFSADPRARFCIAF